MNWADTVRATALATLAGRTTTAGATFAGSAPSWNRDDVWLARAKHPDDRAHRTPVRDPATPVRDVAAQND